MKKPYIYNFAVWYFRENKRAFIGMFLISCAMIPLRNNPLSWIGISFMLLFVTLVFLGAIDYLIHKKRK